MFKPDLHKLKFSPAKINLDRSLFRKPFFQKFVLTPPTGGVRGWKNWLSGLVYPVRLGQVRNAIKSSIIGPLNFLSHFFKIQKNDSIKGYSRSVRGWKNELRGLWYPVRLGQVRIAIKSSIIQNTKAPIHLLACFEQKYERTTSSQIYWLLGIWSNCYWKLHWRGNDVQLSFLSKVAFHT